MSLSIEGIRFLAFPGEEVDTVPMAPDSLFDLSLIALLAAFGLAFFAGFIKGAVGFALPMIMLAGLGSIMEPAAAVAGLVLPALVTNLWQALRQGVFAAWQSVLEHWRFLVVMLIFIAISAQFLAHISDGVLFLILGLPVTVFATIMLIGWSPRVAPENRVAELGVAIFAGALGGLCGVWGPPTVLYLTALETEKKTQMRFQGVVYGSGALVLTLSHLRSGVLSGESLNLSLALILPALVGLYIGFHLQDRLDQKLFRKLTLLILIVAGLNLVRRGVAIF